MLNALTFTPENPFPLLPAPLRAYALEQEHSRQVDAWLGFDIERIEEELKRGYSGTWFGTGPDTRSGLEQQPWIGLPSKSLLTPYTEIREALTRLKLRPGSRVVDLGAGYGRMAFVIGTHFPELEFTGYELIRERVEEAQRALTSRNFSNVKIEQRDLALEGPCEADCYFLFDFGSRPVISKCLGDLRAIAMSRSITVVGRGRASRDEIERRHPWLSSVVEPEHLPRYSIYRS